MDPLKILHVEEEKSYSYPTRNFYKLKMVLGHGTNNYVEINSLTHLLIFALEKNCNRNIVIKWLNSASHYHPDKLIGLMRSLH